jgi:CelD/BcsL family acetyltransferase involved in cellulose biosynthesis
MKVEVATSMDGAGDLIAAWDALALLDRRDGFFRTRRWCQAWVEHIRPQARPFIPVVRDDAGQIIGLAPLFRMTYSDLGFRNDAIAWAGRDVVSGDFLDLVADPSRRAEVTSAVIEHLCRSRDQWGLLVMSELIVDGCTHRLIDKEVESRGLGSRQQEPRLCPYIGLPRTFEEYLGTLSSSMRYHIRRRQRDVIEKSGATIERYSEPLEVASNLGVLSRLHEARWTHEGQPGTLGRPGFSGFLNQVCSDPPEGGSSALYVLRHQGSPVAAVLMFYFGDTAIYYQAGWDPGSPLAAMSPAVVLMARSIQDAIASGLTYYEFLRGDEAYKSRWTKTHRSTVSVLVAGGGLGRTYLAAARIKDGLKQALRPPAGKLSPKPEVCAERQ